MPCKGGTLLGTLIVRPMSSFALALVVAVPLIQLSVSDVLVLDTAISDDDECQDSDASDASCSLSALQLRRGLRAEGAEGAADGTEADYFGQVQWTNHPDKCLDVTDGLARNGNHLQLWDCLSSSASQQFSWNSADGKLRWTSHPEFCVDIHDHGNFNGNSVQLWECISSNSDQSFTVSSFGKGHIKWTSHPDKCLDVRDHQTHNGNRIQIWSCSDANSDQDFSFRALGPPSTSAEPPTSNTADPSVPDSSEFDVIVVGAGLVGSAVAARLAEKLPATSKVLLLEAGRASHSSLGGADPPATWKDSRWQEWPDMEGQGFTRYDVPANYEVLQCWGRNCPESWGDLIPYFQCKVLGGCGVMNGALVQVPHEAMFASWPVGWRGPDFAPYLQAAQSAFHITDSPSGDGKHYLDDAGANFVRNAFAKAGFVTTSSLRVEANTMGTPHVTADRGLRQSTASVFLPKALQEANFELRLETEVVDVWHDAGKARGVRVKADGGIKTLRLKPGGLLVLSAGALNTPRLLLASGLTANGQVGKYLSDHALMSLVYKTPSSAGVHAAGATESFSLEPPRDSQVMQYVSSQSGPLTQFGPTLTAFVRDPSTPGPQNAYDVEVWVNPVGKAGELHVSLALMRPTCSQATLSVSGSRLHSHGSLFLACDRDRRTMDFALDQVDRWLGMQGAKRVYKSEARALNHWAGTCALGRCVDPRTLRLHGISNLAVADASILPEQVWGHPALTLSALALKAADVLVASL